jgi:hypothetical protein
MARNRRKNTNSLPAAGICRGVVYAVFAMMAGLGYVYLSYAINADGQQVCRLENEIKALDTQNEVARTQLASLSSRSVLQRRLNEGFIKMVQISDASIVRINASTPTTIAALRPISNRVNQDSAK